MVLGGRGCALYLKCHRVSGYISLFHRKQNAKGKQKDMFPCGFAHRLTPIVVHRKQRPNLSISDFKTACEGEPHEGGRGLLRDGIPGNLKEKLKWHSPLEI